MSMGFNLSLTALLTLEIEFIVNRRLEMLMCVTVSYFS